MMANHTSIHTLLQRIIVNYNKLREKNAFLQEYKKESIFSNGFEEFDESKEVVESLVEEYKAAERSDYLDWGFNE